MTKVTVLDHKGNNVSIKLRNIPIGTYFKATHVGSHKLDPNEVLIKLVCGAARLSGNNIGGFFDCYTSEKVGWDWDVVDYQPFATVEIFLK